MLAGRRPFKGATSAETQTAIIREEPELLEKTAPNAPVAIRLIVERCLAKEPRGRYESTADLARELQAWRQHGSESDLATAPAEDRPGRHRFVTRVLISVSVVAVAVAVVLAVRLEKGPPDSPGPPSVLALPCKVLGAPEAAFLTDAVPQTISTLLAEVDGLDTKVPPTSQEVEKVKGDLSRLAELYQVSSFIVTSLTTSPGRFALNVQLVDAATRKVWWGRQFEGPREAYNDLARQAAEGIRQAVTPAAPPVPTATASSEAELAFREGTHFAGRYISRTRPADFEAAMSAFQRALVLDPTFAKAAVGVGTLVLFGSDATNDVEGGRKPAEMWARRALAVDPRCGQAWALLSHIEIRAIRPDPESGIEYAIKAVSLEPRAPEGHWMLGLWLADPGSLSLWAAGHLRAFELDPLWTLPAADGAIALNTLGKPNDAIAVLERALRIEPDSPHLQYAQAFVLLKLGRYEEAKTSLRASEAGSTARHVAGEIWKEARLQLAVAQRDASTSEKLAREIVGAALEDHADALSVQNAMLFAVPALARMGKTDDAIRVLLRSVEVRSPPPYDWLLREPDFAPLRADPRFATVLAASREGAEMVARVLQEARARGELPKHLEPPLEELVRLLKQPTG
jgi:tetratricopeptide (TPR) repeat protein